MKINKPLVLLFSVLLLMEVLPSAVAAANTLTGTLNYLAQENTVVVSGNSAGEAAQSVDIMITKGDAAPSCSIMPVSFQTVRTTADGEYIARIALAPDIEGGVYRVTAASNGQLWHDCFVFVNESSVISGLPKVNGAASAAEVCIVLDSAYEAFGLFKEEYERAKERIASMVFGRRPANGYDSAAAVCALAKEAISIEKVMMSPGLPTELLRENAALLGIEYATYEALDSREQTVLVDLLRAADYTKQSFAAVYGDALILTKIRGASNWQSMKTQVLLYAEELELKMGTESQFANVRNQDEIFQIMFKKDLSSRAKVRASFDEAVNEAQRNQRDSAGGKGSGGESRSPSGLGNLKIEPEALLELTKRQAFSDIEGHWAKDDIEKLAESGLIAGYGDGTFCPDRNITRAEFVKLVADVFSLADAAMPDYTDVKKDDWFYPYLQKASALVRGYDGMFYPDSYITRQDAAVIFYRMLENKNAAPTGFAAFADDEELADYARDSVGALAATGLVKGRENGFAPRDLLTRAETVRLTATIRDYLEY